MMPHTYPTTEIPYEGVVGYFGGAEPSIPVLHEASDGVVHCYLPRWASRAKVQEIGQRLQEHWPHHTLRIFLVSGIPQALLFWGWDGAAPWREEGP